MFDEMKRGRSQVIWRYAPGASFRYNDSGAWCITTGITLKNAQALEGSLAEAVKQCLHRWRALGPSGYPDPEIQPSKYVVGEPYQVMYDVWPLVFKCRRCGRVQWYRELAKLRQVNESLSCRECGGRECLVQIPYAYVCECGRLESIAIPRHDPGHSILLEDKHTFQDSFWRCRTCGTRLQRNPKEGLGYRPCSCAPGKAKRGVTLDDSRAYYSQTANIVDIEPAVLDRWKENVHFSDVLLAAVLQVPAYQPSHLLDLALWRSPGDAISPEMRAMRDLLVAGGMSAEQADAMVRQSLQAAANPWTSYEAQLAPLRPLSPTHVWSESRQTVEYIFVRDEPTAGAIRIDDLIESADAAGDEDAAARLRSDRQLASELGLINLRIVEALPILLAGVGYTRYFASPQDAATADGSANVHPVVLRQYAEQDHRIPIYAARNTTEALLYELDPWRLAAFLQVNAGLSVPHEAKVSTPAVRAWLLGQCGPLVTAGESHLVLQPFEQEIGQVVHLPSALLFGVVHTISHVLKATAHRYVGIDSDTLAEYLFPAHAAGLLYASTYVQFTLGGIDSVFRSNLTQWLACARDYAGSCSFDPICMRSGGACLACVYTKFGCAHFNRTLSRSFLFGGEVKGYDGYVEGFWSPRVAAAAQQLQQG